MDDELFAVRLASGDIGYVAVMGRCGAYNALAVYTGDEGFRSYRTMAGCAFFSGSEFRKREMLLQQNCLQTALENMEALMPEELDEARAYAKQNGIRLSGKNAFPHFLKYEPGCRPWKVQTKADRRALGEAMEAAILLAGRLETQTPESLGIFSVDPDTKEVPLFSVNEGTLVSVGFAPLPAKAEENHAYVKAENQIALASVKKLPKRGVWETELVLLPDTVQPDPKKAPYYPMMLMTVEKKSQFLVTMPLITRDDMEPQTALQLFANTWKAHKFYPKEIRCRDERTYALLKDFCEKTGVKIGIHSGTLSALDDAQAVVWAYLAAEKDDEQSLEMEEAMDAVLSMSKAELRTVPMLVAQLRFMLGQNMFPAEIARDLEKKLKGI